MNRFTIFTICAVAWVALAAGACGERTAGAKDYFLAIGGGQDASGNQASLERDLQFATATIAARAKGDARAAGEAAVEIYFADGDDPARDVQYVDAAAEKACPPLVRVMAELFGAPEAVAFRYRDHVLEGVVGPTEFELLERRFAELGRELKTDDRLFVIAAGHGGEAFDHADEGAEQLVAEETADDGAAGAAGTSADAATDSEESGAGEEDASFNRFDTTLSLWNHDELLASELSAWLDGLPGDVEVVLIMGQCYSGGFANVIFNEADAAAGLSPTARCGFFSQLHHRPAAGCAADLDDPDVHEYSSYFWAALGGRTRDGAAVDADFDKRGGVSLAEAHAYAVIESDTLDVPVRTSEALLRAYSRLGGPFELQEGPMPGSPAAKKLAEAIDGLREPRGALVDLAASARVDQRAILEGLPAKISDAAPRTVEDVRVELGLALERVDEAEEALEAAMTATDEALLAAQDEICEAWPELHFRDSTAAAELLAASGDEIAKRALAMESYAALRAAREREKQLTDEADAAEAAAARVERLLRTIEDVVLAENLGKVAPAEIVARYKKMVTMEEGGL